jgi:hypothetical protein
MKQPLFPSTIGTQSRFAYFLTVKAVVRKFGKSDGQTGSWCLDKAVLAQGGGGQPHGIFSANPAVVAAQGYHYIKILLITPKACAGISQEGNHFKKQ